MNTSQEKKKLFNLLFQVNDYSKKISELSKEINIIIQKLNLSSLNLNTYIEQLNTTIKSLKLDVKTYYDQFRYNKSTVPKDNDLKIYIGFKQPSGIVHTFETQYGTTVDKLISTYLKEVEKDKNQNDFCFVYNNKQLNLGDMALIENVFNDKQNPTVFVEERKNFKNLNKRRDELKYTDFDFII